MISVAINSSSFLLLAFSSALAIILKKGDATIFLLLVEALGAGNAVVAHDNRFNRLVAGKRAMYFSGADGFARCMDQLIDKPYSLENLRQHALMRFQEAFTWPDVLAQYEALLMRYLPV